jgi:hypothetical protein
MFAVNFESFPSMGVAPCGDQFDCVFVCIDQPSTAIPQPFPPEISAEASGSGPIIDTAFPPGPIGHQDIGGQSSPRPSHVVLTQVAM